MNQLNDETYMKLALQMAETTKGQTELNPVVGCVIVKEGRVIGMGAHLKMGTAHAEVQALNMAGEEAENSTAYVTLEPCSHYGKTPPCAERLIQEKVKRVVVACTDPNPHVAGRGIQKLRNAGIEVDVGLLEQEAIQLNEIFNKYIINKMPFVTLKTASTLDGKIASKTGDSKWITNESSREFVHTLRHQHQAIMVGVETVIADDPSLTTRLSVDGIQPIRIIVDSNLRTPLDSKVIHDQNHKTILLSTENVSLDKIKQFEELGVEIILCGSDLQVNLTLAMQQLSEQGIGSILLEGGGRLNGAMLEAKLIDKFILFYAPKIIGGEESPTNFLFPGFKNMSDAIVLENIQTQSFENDICITGYPNYGGD
ncbi:bifunctional diaminohydroxyphosphoribosylaminopyrimidine deaminase/5-amino-6-(5-phosphoribosylamino)uracil reductase RibD [Chengkuizengella sediminis]|uniref:bifunctional diaminohydroxyphosphoribosylaminopyrimidine deaminase/5-amino-6-(5-phosphoribosylamino)uracil reductase RibD n=1 Tax=Chengkuizengella sediminis TaxID=1885917 RepID=UPI001389FA2D|nr:bifunctional diaminohydroxyphosphoribosylaminopyrimidine deaminase/5-amino-6-(5-phosphoribosylamino)uracil reductase RibD [Chengkuizengella sediminis]NDI34301.1 bifunctional diaminohydroxyphosphoribosylaminopyrimidine deaminase/5-amino-6-(5-phosphoribosylamino)uracil reductase RibD [Chengkuizengella sediminis]